MLVIAVSILSNCNTKRTCEDLKEGKYMLVSKETGTTVIERKVNEQIEINESLGVHVKYDLKWKDNCTYLLYNDQFLDDNYWIRSDTKDTLIVEITDIMADSYIVKASMGSTDLVIESELLIIE